MKNRVISPTSLLLSSISAILGSGWLFAAFYTTEIAGPAAILSWIIGGAIMIGIAYIFAEICTMIPITGSGSRIPQCTHGTLTSFLFAWIHWLAYMSLAPTETQSVIQYAAYYFPNLTGPSGALTQQGYLVATLIMLCITTINTYSVHWLVRFNNFLTVIKILVPITIGIIILVKFGSAHSIIHPAHQPFMPHGVNSIFTAISAGGIVFVFFGFKQAAELAGEAQNPGKAVPIAVIGSILATLAIFLLIQFAFFSSLTPSNLVNGFSHIHLNYPGSPLASILVQDKLDNLLPILYFAAMISPLAAGLIYFGSSTRSLYAMSKNHYLPSIFQKLTSHHTPIYGIILTFCIGMTLFLPLPGWKNMMAFLTSLMAFTYAVGPINLLALRKQAPDHPRPFRLPCGRLWANIAFVVCTLMVYWSGWQILSKLSIAIAIGLTILFAHRYTSIRKGRDIFALHFQASIWLWTYFIGITIFSYLGGLGGGTNILKTPWDIIGICIFCQLVLFLAQRYQLSTTEAAEFIDHCHEEHRLHQDELPI